MDVKCSFSVDFDVSSEAPARLSGPDLFQLAMFYHPEQVQRDVYQLVMYRLFTPYRPEHQEQVIASQMATNALYQRLGGPRLSFGCAQFRD